MLDGLPDNVAGQRDGDRAPGGSNLMHDQAALKTMRSLGGRYATSADRYLETFATTCIDSATGLFPWGEHAYWDLVAGNVGDSFANRDASRYRPIHDHLRLTPRWLWNQIDAYAPHAIHDYADGLEYHWNDPVKPEYIRHAPITVKDREDTGQRSCDFPRHGGFYIHDWAFAYTRTPHPDYVRRIRTMLDYWSNKRNPAHDGLLQFESRGRDDEISPRQTLSLAVGLQDAAELLADYDLLPGLRDEMRTLSNTYLEGFLAAPHDPENGVFVGTCRERDLQSGKFEPRIGPDVTYEIRPMAIWGDVYSGVLAAPMALLCCSAFRNTEDRRLLDWASDVGKTYVETPFPEDGTIDPETANAVLNPTTANTMDREDEIPIHARDPGLVLGLLTELFELTDEKQWINNALDLAETVLEVYLDEDLPRGAAGLDYYENQLGTGFLLHGLARTALLARDEENCPLGPDFTER